MKDHQDVGQQVTAEGVCENIGFKKWKDLRTSFCNNCPELGHCETLNCNGLRIIDELVIASGNNAGLHNLKGRQFLTDLGTVFTQIGKNKSQ